MALKPDMRSWGVHEVNIWLRSVRLEKIFGAEFTRQNIDGDTLFNAKRTDFSTERYAKATPGHWKQLWQNLTLAKKLSSKERLQKGGGEGRQKRKAAAAPSNKASRPATAASCATAAAAASVMSLTLSHKKFDATSHTTLTLKEVTGSWVTNEEGGGDWTIHASGKTTYDNKDYGSKYYIKEDPTGLLRRGDGWMSGPESTADRLIWTFKNKDDVVWTRSHRLKLQQVAGPWVTHEEGGGDWTIDASGKTTYDNQDYGTKYYIKEDPTGVLRRGDGWVSGPESTADRLIWTFKGRSDVMWTRRHRIELYQVTGAWLTREEGGGNWTIDASGKTTYNNKDYGSKYYIKEDPTGALRRGDGWVSAPNSTADRLVWIFKNKKGVVWVRRNYLQLHQVVGSWVTHEEGGGNWTIDASGKTTYDNKDYGPKYHIKQDPTGVLRRGDGWVSAPDSTANRLVWTYEDKNGNLLTLVWTRHNSLKLQQVVGSWSTQEESGGEWAIDASGKTTLDGKDYGPKYHIKQDPNGFLRRGDGWVSSPASTGDRLVWTLKTADDSPVGRVVWTRHRRLDLSQVVGPWVTNEEGGGDWTIDASGKTTLDGKDYGPKYHIKQDPTGVLRRGDGWVSAPDSTEDRLIWTFKGKKDVIWIRQFY